MSFHTKTGENWITLIVSAVCMKHLRFLFVCFGLWVFLGGVEGGGWILAWTVLFYMFA